MTADVPEAVETGKTESPLRKYIVIAMLAIAVFSLGLQVMPLLTNVPVTAYAANDKISIEAITAQVLPQDGFTIDAIWGDSVSRMTKSGVLDANKLDNTLTKRYNQPLTARQKALLSSDYSNEKLTINSENAVFMMYMLWALAKGNNNTILLSSPFADSFGNYDMGAGKAGYGDTNLLALTPEQQEIAGYVAANSYRPCCGQPTSHPDCSHGFSALGLIELMASQGFSKAQIFDAFVKFNSYWFPATYVQDAMYFKLSEGRDWDSVDKELVAGQQYSSITGANAVKKYLQDAGF